MTPDPLPVALPEPMWPWKGNGPRPYEDAYSESQMIDCARAHASAALRAQAEEVAALRADAERWRAVPAFLEEFQIDYTGLLRAVDDYRAHLASKQEKP